MEQNFNPIGIKHLYPKDGYYLTQANRDNNERPILSTDILLSVKDKVENWVEIEKDEGIALHREWDNNHK